MSISSFAGIRLDGVQGQWKNNDSGWWWENADSSYPINQWVWLDGNGDNIAECYYFDEKGYMAANKDVDGYHVNADGQWVDMYGTVQTKQVSNESVSAGNDHSSIYDSYYEDNLISPNDETQVQVKKKIEYPDYDDDNWRKYIDENNPRYQDWVNAENKGLHVFYNGKLHVIMYEFTEEQKREKTYEVSDEINQVIDDFKDTYNIKGRSDIEKEILILLYIANNCKYSFKGARKYDAEGCLLDGKAVCSGYSEAFYIMAEQCGLDAFKAWNGKGDGDHAWNKVKIDGKWYNVDPTWADSGTHLNADYINISDEACNKIAHHEISSSGKYKAKSNYSKEKIKKLIDEFYEEYFITQEELDKRAEREAELARREEKKKAFNEKRELEKAKKAWTKKRDNVKSDLRKVNSLIEELNQSIVETEKSDNYESEEAKSSSLQSLQEKLEKAEEKRDKLSKELEEINEEGEANHYQD